MNYRVFPPEGYLEGSMTLPLSKSMSNRALIINALTPGVAGLERVAECDDTRVMRAALAADAGAGATVDVEGAGTAMRFLTAYFAAKPGARVTLTGSDRMRRRPVGALVDALRSLGAEIEYAGEEGFPPLRIAGRRLHGGALTVDASISSQFVSALMMVAPTMEAGLTLTLDGVIVSRPYIAMTAAMMTAAGADVEFYNNEITVAAAPYTRPGLEPERDWSAAAYAYLIQSLASGEMTLPGLRPDSCQGDSALAGIYRDLGVVTRAGEDGVTLEADPDCSPRMVMDMTDVPDLVPSIVVNLCMLGIPFRLTGLKTLRVKECDRVQALCDEMLKVGCVLAIEGDDTLTWENSRRPVTELPEFDTYDDHRMAMSLAPVSLYVPGIVVRDAEVVAKSFPGYWEQLAGMGFMLVDASLSAEEVNKMLETRDEE